MDAHNLHSTIKSCRDLMRKDEGLSSDVERLPQFSWMLFLKCFHDHEIRREKKSKKYKRILPNNLRWENWTNPKNCTRTNFRCSHTSSVSKRYPTIYFVSATKTRTNRNCENYQREK